MHIRPWLAVTALTAISFVAVYAQLPRETWATMAALSLACGVGALTLLIHSSRTLTRASAHATPDASC